MLKMSTWLQVGRESAEVAAASVSVRRNTTVGVVRRNTTVQGTAVHTPSII